LSMPQLALKILLEYSTSWPKTMQHENLEQMKYLKCIMPFLVL
jgi:hypothetical protein